MRTLLIVQVAAARFVGQLVDVEFWAASDYSSLMEQRVTSGATVGAVDFLAVTFYESSVQVTARHAGTVDIFLPADSLARAKLNGTGADVYVDADELRIDVNEPGEYTVDCWFLEQATNLRQPTKRRLCVRLYVALLLVLCLFALALVPLDDNRRHAAQGETSTDKEKILK